jgi:hypothetical protein
MEESILEIKMYPLYNEVFVTNDLYGVFYPLCSINKNLHFVSSNGLWLDKKYETERNTFNYTKFEFANGKYDFKGDIRLYKGYEYAKGIFPLLENDFEKNGKDYLQNKIKTNFYIEKIKKLLSLQKTENIDIDYYLSTFYEFCINKLNYNLNGKFGEFNHLIKDGAKNESPVVYTDADIINEVEEALQEKIDVIKGYSAIGKVVGYEFFTDGNDSVLYFNEKENEILSINCYS